MKLINIFKNRKKNIEAEKALEGRTNECGMVFKDEKYSRQIGDRIIKHLKREKPGLFLGLIEHLEINNPYIGYSNEFGKSVFFIEPFPVKAKKINLTGGEYTCIFHGPSLTIYAHESLM